ncbi:MAG: ATP phosphoribosyltransferase regulatory subunit [Sandaracinus sp.]|nr:ATP phosphoribosyltransferase regulatory subunit [Sandaracinus sp.]MCB9619022.1 ATP phosphoribosyltransferase regulatory subunit [Sandaracinus sp.]
MRDHLPPDAALRASLTGRLLAAFETFGYERVTTPAFEYAEVIERGLEVDRRDVLRFVEPDTGEVALLRPDITPQIARIVATSLRDRPAPWRLCYSGTVLRRARGRARRNRQLAQAGVEHVGTASLEADVEVIRLAADSLRGVGLSRFRLELGQVRIGKSALAAVPDGLRHAAADALARKDGLDLERVLVSGRVLKRERKRLGALLELYGDGDEAIVRARRRFKDEASRAALDELAALYERLAALGLSDVLGVDLGELRGHAYYTGASFTLLAEGPGEPLGGGGRYDRLLERFGLAAPATGFGVDVENLWWALSAAGVGWSPPRPARIVALDVPDALIDALRSRGAHVATLPAPSVPRNVAPSVAALEFAQAWGYDALLFGADRLVRASDGVALPFGELANVDFEAWAFGGTSEPSATDE